MNGRAEGVSGAGHAPREKSPKSVKLVLIGAAVLVVAALVWAGAAFISASQADPHDSAPKPVGTAPSTAPASPETTPSPDVETTVAVPADCSEVYPQTFLDRMAGEELNHESLVDSPISRYPAIEELRESQPGFECHWGLATEGGVANGVNTITPGAQDAAIAVIEASGHLCEPYREGTVCRYSEVLEGEDETGTAWTIAEEHFFRDGLWVSTWWAGTESSIEAETSGIYSTIWP